MVNYSNGTDPFLEVEAEVRDQGRGNALWVRQQPWSLGSIIPRPTASLGFDSSPTLHALKNENTKHCRLWKNRCISRTRSSFLAGCCVPRPSSSPNLIQKTGCVYCRVAELATGVNTGQVELYLGI